MRKALITTLLVLSSASPLLAQEHEAASGGSNLLELHGGLMFWTLVIFVGLLVILTRFAFRPLTDAVAAREAMLEEAIQSAKRDREAAAKLLEEQRAQIEAARNEAQRYIADGRAAGEKLRAEMIEQTRHDQQELIERARREIDNEKVRAIADLRREAVDLAIAGASKVIEKNLDEPSNRRLVESFLAGVGSGKAAG